MPPRRKQSARKSTSKPDKPSDILQTDKTIPVAPLRARARNPFSEALSRMPSPSYSDSSSGFGPRYGIGKGNMKRLKKVLKRQNQMPSGSAMDRYYEDENKRAFPMRPFIRILKELLEKRAPGFRFQLASLDILRQASEQYLLDMFELANQFTSHGKRVTLFPSDINLAKLVTRRLNDKLVCSLT